MTAERLQPNATAAALFPRVELIADEADLFPQTANHARSALRCDLDHRRHNFEHTAVEIERAAGRQLHRLVRPLEQRPVNEARRRLPNLLRRRLSIVDEDLEFGLYADDRQLELRCVRESFVVSWHTAG